MAQTVSPSGAQYEAFTTWVKAQGVKINGVESAKISGRGLGIVARRRIEVGEELVRVPVSALLKTDSIPEHFKTLHRGITAHGLLASFLAHGGSEASFYSPWKATWPSSQDFQESMPILWPELLRGPLYALGHTISNIDIGEPSFLLPPAVGGKWTNLVEYSDSRREAGLLYRQEERLKADWEIVSKVFPDQTLSEYTYFWLVVHTRSLYYFDALGGGPPGNHDDRMVLCPFIDYFNHQDHGCDVTFNDKGYIVTSDRAYDVGEEIYVTYGAHGNDFLLVEYGFILERNKWDSLRLDDFFCGKRLDKNSKARLKDAGYFGDYTLTAEGVCHRTQVAVRTQTSGSYQWKRFVERGEATEERDQSRADSYLCVQVLQIYFREAESALQHLRKMPDVKVPPHIKLTLIRRWEQIKALIRSAFQNGIDLYTQARTHETFNLPSPVDDGATAAKSR